MKPENCLNPLTTKCVKNKCRHKKCSCGHCSQYHFARYRECCKINPDLTTCLCKQFKVVEEKALEIKTKKICGLCTDKDTMGPSHNGKKNCESGSIASGGNKSHCTCDICF